MATKKDPIAKFEARVGHPLPTQFREFLSNGSPWSKYGDSIKLGKGRDWPDVIEFDLMLQLESQLSEEDREEPEVPTLEFMLDVMQNRKKGDGCIPKAAITIAMSETDEQIVLFCSGPNSGQVWLKQWQTLDREGKDDPNADLKLVATDFEGLLKVLGPAKRRKRV